MSSRALITRRVSTKANQSISSIDISTIEAASPSLARGRHSQQPESDDEWQSEDENIPATPPKKQSNVLPKGKLALADRPLINKTPSDTVVTSIKGCAVRGGDPQKLAQAALGLENSTNTRSISKPLSSLQPFHAETPPVDPALLALSCGSGALDQNRPQVPPGLVQYNIDNIEPTEPNLESPIGETGNPSFEPSILQPTKRKDIDNSPVKTTKRFRPTIDYATELQAPLPPPRALLPQRTQFQTGHGSVEVRHRVSLPHIQNQVQTNHISSPAMSAIPENSSPAVPQNPLFVEYLKKHNQHLEAQLFNRNFENHRQIEEIRRANTWATQAKNCMRRDGDDINHLKMLILYAKNKIEIWEKMLHPLSILEPEIENSEENQEEDRAMPVNNAKAGIASRICHDARDVIKNFDKALKDVITRPVEQLDDRPGEISDHIATFRA
ncbi:hypothetical protein ABW19_dt0206895 [Dactylella cylindrospora]|nr:hypothetical protein ABW19_dt0206895 [Dactylella cylindrospora]